MSKLEGSFAEFTAETIKAAIKSQYAELDAYILNKKMEFFENQRKRIIKIGHLWWKEYSHYTETEIDHFWNKGWKEDYYSGTPKQRVENGIYDVRKKLNSLEKFVDNVSMIGASPANIVYLSRDDANIAFGDLING